MMDLKEWLKEQMGDEYNPGLTTSENITTLVGELKSLRRLAVIVKDYADDLIDWMEEDEQQDTDSQTGSTVREESNADENIAALRRALNV